MKGLTINSRITLLKEKNIFFRWSLELAQEMFPILLTTFLLLLLVETIFEGSVSLRINLNQLLIIVTVVGIIVVLTASNKRVEGEKDHLTVIGILTMLCGGVVGAVILWYKTQELGWLSHFISITSGVLIMFLLILIYQRNEDYGNERENNRGN